MDTATKREEENRSAVRQTTRIFANEEELTTDSTGSSRQAGNSRTPRIDCRGHSQRDRRVQSGMKTLCPGMPRTGNFQVRREKMSINNIRSPVSLRELSRKNIATPDQTVIPSLEVTIRLMMTRSGCERSMQVKLRWDFS